jgi:hypothetical protein
MEAAPCGPEPMAPSPHVRIVDIAALITAVACRRPGRRGILLAPCLSDRGSRDLPAPPEEPPEKLPSA